MLWRVAIKRIVALVLLLADAGARPAWPRYLSRCHPRNGEPITVWQTSASCNITGWTLKVKVEEPNSVDHACGHFLEGHIGASFGTNPLAMSKAIRLMETGLVDAKQIISHRLTLERIKEAVELMESRERTKVIINP